MKIMLSSKPITIKQVSGFPGASHGYDCASIVAQVEVRTKQLKAEDIVERILLNVHKLVPRISKNFPEINFQEAEMEIGLALLLLETIGGLQKGLGLPLPAAYLNAKNGDGLIGLIIPTNYLRTGFAAIDLALKIINEAISMAQKGSEMPIAKPFLREFKLAHEKFYSQSPEPECAELIREAGKRNIPWFDLGQGVFQLGQGSKSQRIQGERNAEIVNNKTSSIQRKYLVNNYLQRADFPVPVTKVVLREDQATAFANEIGYPVVINRYDENWRQGSDVGLTNNEELQRAFELSPVSESGVIIEKYVAGDHYQFHIVGGKFTVTKQAVGNETKTEESCKAGKESTLPTFDIKSIHPDNINLSERCARFLSLEAATVILTLPDITKSWMETEGGLSAVYAPTSFNAHCLARRDKEANAGILNKMSAGMNGRVPIAAITGTNGKSTVSLMLNAILKASGLNSGVNTTQGIWIGEEKLSKTELSGFPGGRTLLTDPSVDAAVIEMPRKGLLGLGFPFDYCDVAALLNIQDDHIGEFGIANLKEMAELKGRVLLRARKAIIVNADDAFCLTEGLRHKEKQVIFVSKDKQSPIIQAHVRNGGTAMVLTSNEDGRRIEWLCGNLTTVVMATRDIPATMNGIIGVNEHNAVFATALAHAMGVGLPDIRKGMLGFENSLEMNPGRYNFIEGYPFKLMIDFAHNYDGLKGVVDCVSKFKHTGNKIVLYKAIGMRHYSHVEHASRILAPAFDEFICSTDLDEIRKNPEYKDKPDDWLIRQKAHFLENYGVDDAHIHLSRSTEDDRKLLYRLAKKDDLVVMLTGVSEAHKILDGENP
ncbi:MAG: Mur ligase family protein [Porticoccaceae bacterium]